MHLSIRPFTNDEARVACQWRYPAPYELYDSDPDDVDLFCNAYLAVVTDEELVGFCCFGPEARVRGQVEEPGTLDIGGGLRPDLTSQGIATELFPTVLEFGAAQFCPQRFRTAVAAFNERSLRLCQAAGFAITRTFEGPGREFHELVLHRR